MPRAFPLVRHSSRIERSSTERRLETRFNVNEPVKVTLLSGSGDSFWGNTLDVSASGLSFVTPVRLPVGTLVKLEVDDSMVLGEVRHSGIRADSPAQHLVGINIEHVLFGWRELYERVRDMEGDATEAETLIPALR